MVSNMAKKRRRSAKTRTAKKLIIIRCEGEETEINYYRSLFDENPNNKQKYVLDINQPRDHSPYGIIKAVKLEVSKKIKDDIPKEDVFGWGVFDRDGHARIPDAIQMARDNNIQVVFSSVCFVSFMQKIVYV